VLQAIMLGVISLVPCIWCGAARAQEMDDEPVAVPEQAVESYLERLGLKRLLADLLEKRLAATPKDVRVQPAERLSRIYVELLGAAQTSSERQLWEEKAKALLAQVPDADSFDLRLSLGKAVYIRAEEIAERQRLRMATPEELAEAEKVFRGLLTQFNDIASKAHRRVDTLERVEQTGEATDKALADLSDARRQRSLAFYFAGWANYYLALLTHADQPAVDATRCFGWLLNSGSGRPATPDRVQASMFQYEHVARAAVGCALSASLRGNDAEALRWLDAVTDSEQTPESVREQLAPRRVVVLGASKRWADLELFIRRTRKADRNGGGPELTPLPTPLARLLAVITLEADKRTAGPQIESLAKIALGDLVARKEVGQVLDLVGKFGTAPIGDTGFIVHYVRALQAYDVARKLHEANGAPAEEPTTDAKIANQYKTAASMFQGADQQPDADQFGAERVRAVTMQGRSLFFAGDLVGAADAFTAAWKLVGKGNAGEEPLWLGVLALERAAKEPTAPEIVKTRLNQAITLFLQNYPESEKAPRLTLMQVSLGALGDDEALKVLSAVSKDSPVYEAARRQVARILYARFRSARGAEKDFAAARFVAVAEDVLAADRKIALENKVEDAKPAVEWVIVRARQLLDALLSVSSPDVARAESVLKILTGVASFNNYDLKAHMAELTYRELQVAAAKNDVDQMESAVSRLLTTSDPGGQFQAAGERLMYRHVSAKYKPGSEDGEQQMKLAQGVVKYGIKVIDRIGSDPQQIKDANALGVYSQVAGAALELSKRTGDTQQRDLAIRLDRTILSVQPRMEVSLRRLAEASESAGDFATASANWRTILDAAPAASELWFEAKYQAIRLLSKLDISKARAAMREHLILYPTGGPEPWGKKIEELDASMGPEPVPAPPAPATPSGTPGAAGGAGSGGGGT
jgi:hypothetical protein